MRYLLFFAIVSWIGVAHAQQVIDFETIQDSTTNTIVTPQEGDPVWDQYFIDPWNIVFTMKDSNFNFDGYPQIAQVGPQLPTPFFAFDGPVTTYPTNCGQTNGDEEDIPAANESVGCYFLTDGASGVTTANQMLFIQYGVGVQAASAAILDIDGNEAWTVAAFDTTFVTALTVPIATYRVCSSLNNGGIPATGLYGDPCTTSSDTGDGIAHEFTIGTSNPNTPIRSILIAFDGANVNGTVPATNVGLAFDNFSPDAPQPPLPCTGTVTCTNNNTGAAGNCCGCACNSCCSNSGQSDGSDSWFLKFAVMVLLSFVFIMTLVVLTRTNRG